MSFKVEIVGGGLAGVEAAYQLAKRKINVDLYEMRPHQDAKAHHSDKLAELVCSNSLKSDDIFKASGLLKKEMEVLDSIILKNAYKCRVPAGQSLSVDREKFSSLITKEIEENPYINIIREEYSKISKSNIVIIASGPLTSNKLSYNLEKLIDKENLYFYDAAAPLIEADSINYDIAFFKSRYDKGGADYLNLGMNREEFDNFYLNLINAKKHPLKEFEKEIYFQACMPIEVIGKKNPKSLLFGPLKPVGLEKDNKRFHAVVQLRKDNEEGSIYNMVGFQTNLLFEEQKRVFRMIPGLEKAKFLRCGVMHRNSFINSPKCLNINLQVKDDDNVFIAGLLSGVEGYVESFSTGLIAALSVYSKLKDKNTTPIPKETMIGSLIYYICNYSKVNFQPINANFGIYSGDKKDPLKSIELIKNWYKENEF